MNRSESIKNIAGALAVFHKEVSSVNRDSKAYNYMYASLPNVLEAIKEPLEKAELMFSQFPDGENSLTTILIHIPTGEFFETTSSANPVKNDPQGSGSLLTYLRRYHLVAILGLNVEDDDGASASGKTTDSKPTYNKSSKNSSKDSSPEDDEKPWLNEKDDLFQLAIEKLKSGETTIDKIKDKFKLSKVVRAKLDEAVATG